MLRPEIERIRPGQEADSQKIATTTSFTSMPPAPDILGDLDALAEHLRGYLVVQIVVDDDGHRRTQVCRSAGAAQRAVERAHERGRTAHVTLCQLLPVGVVVGVVR